MDQPDLADYIADPRLRPWIVLSDTYDVETWITHYNRDLQAAVLHANNPKLVGYGICFQLAEGGELFLNTNGDGDILLDVTPEADWVTPLLTAVTGHPAPTGQIWMLPGEVLTQLIFGLNTLIGSTCLVLDHAFRIKKY
jgi:hypothetical protein